MTSPTPEYASAYELLDACPNRLLAALKLGRYIP